MMQSIIENLGSLFWVNWIGFRYKISLELRVKEKLLRYPEEVFFDSQGIPAKRLSSYPIILVLV